MVKHVTLLLLPWVLWACPRERSSAPPREVGAKPLPVAPTPEPRRPKRAPDPLDARGSFACDAVPLPEVIGTLATAHGISVGVSPGIAVKDWSKYKVTLYMTDVTRRAFLDWLVRPLGAEYAIEGGGRVWITRDGDLLMGEPLTLHTYAVPTHVHAARGVPGRLSFAREQEVIIRTLEAGLRYLLDRREGCRLAFHGEQALLVARLPGPGHARLRELLDAMRHGTDEPEAPAPTLAMLKAALEAPVTLEGKAVAARELFASLARQTKVGFGWDAARLGEPVVAVRGGTRPLAEVLRAVVAQTRLGRYALEPGHGVWLYSEGQDTNYPESGGTPWDRAIVRAYDVRTLLRRVRPQDLLRHLRQRVDPGQWDRGLPSADVFTPTGRLIVVHDVAGQRRVLSILELMMAGELPTPDATEGGRPGDDDATQE